jgi:Histidine kinase/Histidine kinase-, DNA gyrase B-, and HSP90-like ATPase
MMNGENRLPAAVNALQRAAYRLAGSIARLSFWQFALLSLILLAAAAMIEDLWVDASGPRFRAVHKRAAGTADSGDARVSEKASGETEIRIGKDSVIIHRRAIPEKGANAPSPSAPGADASAATPAAAAVTPDARQSQARANAHSEEIRIGEEVLVTRERSPASPEAPDAEGAAGKSSDSAEPMAAAAHPDTLWKPRKPPLVTIALLLLLGLIVMRMFARAQQRAEKRTEAARAIAEREVLQRQVVEARLQLLQAQVEPHFLFNSLAAVEHLIETAPVRAAKMQRHLIDYLRAAVPRMRQQSATLGQEAELCVSYLEIMRMRMEERLQFKVAIPGGLGSARFPPMMLQSLIENSVRHGLEPKSEGGIIDLTAEVRDGKLCVTVADTGLGFSKDARAGVGLANIRERLQQLFGTNGSLTIEPNHPSGTRATITLPYAVP